MTRDDQTSEPIPGSPRLRPEVLSRIPGLLTEALADGQFGGAAWGVCLHGQWIAGGGVGTRGCDPDQPVSEDSLFDIASLTKPVATAPCLLAMLERGAVALGDEASRFFPQLGPEWNGVTLRRLATHTSGLPAYASLHEECHSGAEIRDALLRLSPVALPGTTYEYSCLGYITLQHILQEVAGESLDALAQRLVFQPLGMTTTLFNPGPVDRVVCTSKCPGRHRFLVGEVHDPLAWAGGGVSGNAGVFSSVRDLCRFGAGLLAAARAQSTSFLGAAAARLMLRSQIDPSIGSHSIGFFTHPNPMLPRGDLLPESTVGHTGFTGASLVLVPQVGLVVVLLASSLYHDPDKAAFFRTRRRLHNLVGAALQSLEPDEMRHG